MKTITRVVVVLLIVVVAVIGLAISFGGPGQPRPLPTSIGEPFAKVDYSGLPPVSYYAARDGTKLAYRGYAHVGSKFVGSVVLVHGTGASSDVMHVLAKSFAAAGFDVDALDIRGHGESGVMGQIAYVGQLEDDIEDLVRTIKPTRPLTFVGWSAGGGFGLRVAGSSRQKLFDNYVLLAPGLGLEAPTIRKDRFDWLSVGMPRLIAIALLDAAGVHAFDNLPVVRFGFSEKFAKLHHQPISYCFPLLLNFGPERDYGANIRAVDRPFRVIVGQDDELFYADRFKEVFKAEGKDVPVTIVEGIGHGTIVLEPKPVQAAIDAVKAMD